MAGAESHRQAAFTRHCAWSSTRSSTHEHWTYDWRTSRYSSTSCPTAAPIRSVRSCSRPVTASLVFRGLEPATRPGDVERSVDSRPLTVMFGVWNWTTDVGS